MPEVYRKIGCIKNLEVASVCNLRPAETIPIKMVNVIELTSICNFKCSYCPAPIQAKYRKIGHMTDEVFDQVLKHVRHYVKEGTQEEICTFMFGEPTLHPKLPEMIDKLRYVVPLRNAIHLSTNGSMLTQKLLCELYDSGVTAISLSDHDAPTTKNAIIELRKFKKMAWKPWRGGIWNPNNFAGHVDWLKFEDQERTKCSWMYRSMAAVLSDGRVSACCFDAAAEGIIGSVYDAPGSWTTKPYSRCGTCHQDLPEMFAIEYQPFRFGINK